MRRLSFMLLLIVAGPGTAHAAASDVTIVGGVDFGFKSLRLDTGSGSGVFNPNYVTVNPTVGLSYKSFYASLSYDKSISSDPRSGSDVPAGGPTATVTDYARTDSTLTLGYRLNPSFSLFAGYTKGINKFRITEFNTTLIVTDIDYTETGPFAGIAYSKTFGDKGTLGLSAGYAQLNGELKFAVNPGSFSTVIKGDTKGFSYGISWSGSLTGSLGYRVGVKRTEYEMKDPTKLTERYTSYSLGIVNYF